MSSCEYFVACVIGIITVLYFGVGFLKKWKVKRMLNKWDRPSKDTIILHAFPPALTLPNASPFVLKVQTYLRWAKIPHIIDHEDSFGPKGKCPWLSYNSQHIADSQFILEFLEKKFEKSHLNEAYTKEQLAVASSARIVLEEHFYAGFALERFTRFFKYEIAQKVMNIGLIQFWAMKILLGNIVRKATRAQGIGLHTYDEIYSLLSKDLTIVSQILGDKNFICGSTPCTEDMAIFGILAQVLFALPGSPYEKLMNNELKNLKDYCIRMKNMFYPGVDWDGCLAK